MRKSEALCNLRCFNTCFRPSKDNRWQMPYVIFRLVLRVTRLSHMIKLENKACKTEQPWVCYRLLLGRHTDCVNEASHCRTQLLTQIVLSGICLRLLRNDEQEHLLGFWWSRNFNSMNWQCGIVLTDWHDRHDIRKCWRCRALLNARAWIILCAHCVILQSEKLLSWQQSQLELCHEALQVQSQIAHLLCVCNLALLPSSTC